MHIGFVIIIKKSSGTTLDYYFSTYVENVVNFKSMAFGIVLIGNEFVWNIKLGI